MSPEQYEEIYEETISKRAELTEKILGIENQIDLAEAEGDIDLYWLAQAKHALKKTKATRQTLQDTIGRINRAANKYLHQFHMAAERQLSEEDYNNIHEEAEGNIARLKS